MWPIVIVAVTLFVAYANGANDNCKGVATLFGSAVANGQTRWGGHSHHSYCLVTYLADCSAVVRHQLFGS